jgi:FkbM family methyltransferase
MSGVKVTFETITVKNRAGVEFVIPAGDTRMKQLITGSRVWNSFTMNTLRKLIPKPRTVLDVGANVGQSSIEFARWAKKVIAFEPHPELDALCVRNLAKDPHGKSVVVYNLALSNVQGRAYFSMNPKSSLGAHITDNKSMEVDTELLDNMAAKDVDFVKIDVEGHELRVLKGATLVLGRDTPAVLVEIVPAFLQRYGDTPQEVYDFMLELGYVPFTPKLERTPKTWVHIPRCRDRLFVHASKAPQARGFGFAPR